MIVWVTGNLRIDFKYFELYGELLIKGLEKQKI